jgi:hypothetical protein
MIDSFCTLRKQVTVKHFIEMCRLEMWKKLSGELVILDLEYRIGSHI